MTDWQGEYYEGVEPLENGDELEDNEALRSVLLEVCSYYGFSEVSRTEVIESESEVVRHEVITKGLFTDENRHMGVWFRDLPEEFLPKPLREVTAKAREVHATYTGDKYLLVELDGKVQGFNVDYYHTVVNLAKELGYYVDTAFERVLLNKEKRVLILESVRVYFAVAGMSRPNLEEEERVILSNRLADSQPFFSFKAPIRVDWSRLKEDKAESFERLCESLLAKERDVERVVPVGKSRAADRGRDFEVHEARPLFGEIRVTKWLVQCKFSDTSVSTASISGWTERLLEHHYDGYWLMTNNDTPTLIDQFKGVEDNPNFDFQVRFWQRFDFHIKLNVYSEILTNSYFLSRAPARIA